MTPETDETPPLPPLPITGVAEADRLLAEEPLALLLGMLLDQQVPMEWAFRGPWSLKQRLGGELDAIAIASLDPEALVAVFCDKPALHRYPAAMARRAHAVCLHVAERYDGDAGAIWRGERSAQKLYARIRQLPGYGEEKAKILLAILGKRFGVAPRGWKALALPFSDRVPRSAADVSGPEALARVRAFKREQKRRGLGKAD
ncbi:MAG: HhH-GPD-type base excision DNA repair protein [Polyangiaceae bacterium]